MEFNPYEPVCVGFSGKAGSGKTETAKALIPQQTYVYSDVEKFPETMWDHYWFSAPLYEMANIKMNIEGADTESRKLYLLHNVLNGLMAQRIPYEDLVELVYDIYAMPCVVEGMKPRTFLTHSSDIIKATGYVDCFSDYVKRRIRNDYIRIEHDAERNDQDVPWYIGIVSDVRYPREAEMVKSHQNSILIKFETSDEVREQRLLNRDGVLLTSTQRQHNSETGFDDIPDECYDYIINTDGLTLEEQMLRVRNILGEYVPLPSLSQKKKSVPELEVTK